MLCTASLTFGFGFGRCVIFQLWNGTSHRAIPYGRPDDPDCSADTKACGCDRAAIRIAPGPERRLPDAILAARSMAVVSNACILHCATFSLAASLFSALRASLSSFLSAPRFIPSWCLASTWRDDQGDRRFPPYAHAPPSCKRLPAIRNRNLKYKCRNRW